MNSAWFPRIAYIYKNRDSKETAPADIKKKTFIFQNFTVMT